MNPMQLLTASKSLIGVKDETCRYRMAQGNLLPKFNSPSTPASSPSLSKPTTSIPAESLRAVVNAPVESRPASRRQIHFGMALLLSSATRIRGMLVLGCRSGLAMGRRIGGVVKRVLRTLNRMARWPKKKTVKPSGKSPFRKPPVQGELSLDKVKVVRNDLSEADLEVIPAASLDQPQSSKSITEPETTEVTAASPWERVTSRIFDSRPTGV